MTEPPTDAVEPTAGAAPPDTIAPPAVAEPPRRRPKVERVAALLFAAVFLLPTINVVLWAQARPAEGCMEYCGLDETAANISLGLGIVGLLLAAAIWRRHLSAQAIGLFMCVTVVAVLGIVLAGAESQGKPAALQDLQRVRRRRSVPGRRCDPVGARRLSRLSPRRRRRHWTEGRSKAMV